jgi:hypothetical protein
MGYLLIGFLVSIALLLVIDHIAMMPTIVDNPKFRSKCRVCGITIEYLATQMRWDSQLETMTIRCPNCRAYLSQE